MNWLVDPLRQYANFSGRASRKQYWLFALFVMLIAFALGFLDGILGTQVGEPPQTISIISLIWSLIVFLPSISIAVRRLHDTDRSGWWILIGLVPLVGTIALLIFLVMSGTPGNNRYGVDPSLNN